MIVTDGITEAANPFGALFGMGRVEEFLVSSPPDELGALKRLTAEVRAFECGEPPADDIAALRLALLARGADRPAFTTPSS